MLDTIPMLFESLTKMLPIIQFIKTFVVLSCEQFATKAIYFIHMFRVNQPFSIGNLSATHLSRITSI